VNVFEFRRYIVHLVASIEGWGMGSWELLKFQVSGFVNVIIGYECGMYVNNYVSSMCKLCVTVSHTVYMHLYPTLYIIQFLIQRGKHKYTYSQLVQKLPALKYFKMCAVMIISTLHSSWTMQLTVQKFL